MMNSWNDNDLEDIIPPFNEEDHQISDLLSEQLWNNYLEDLDLED